MQIAAVCAGAGLYARYEGSDPSAVILYYGLSAVSYDVRGDLDVLEKKAKEKYKHGMKSDALNIIERAKAICDNSDERCEAQKTARNQLIAVDANLYKLEIASCHDYGCQDYPCQNDVDAILYSTDDKARQEALAGMSYSAQTYALMKRAEYSNMNATAKSRCKIELAAYLTAEKIKYQKSLKSIYECKVKDTNNPLKPVTEILGCSELSDTPVSGLIGGSISRALRGAKDCFSTMFKVNNILSVITASILSALFMMLISNFASESVVAYAPLAAGFGSSWVAGLACTGRAVVVGVSVAASEYFVK
jgi:hypothetical protein